MQLEHELSSYEFLDQVVERNETGKFAEFMRRSRSLVEKWMRCPTSDEDPNATGVVNPISELDKIMDWCLLYKPELAVLLAGRYQRKLQRFRDRQGRAPLTHAELRAQLDQVIREHADILRALVTGAPVAEVRREIAEFEHEIEELLARLEASENAPKLRHPATIRSQTP